MSPICPEKIDNAKVLCFAILSKLHQPTGNTKHTLNGKVLAPVFGLAICQYENDGGFYLFYCDEKWHTLTDTWHDSLDQAKEQAEFEYEGINQSWVDQLATGYRFYSATLVGIFGAECWGPHCDADVLSTGQLEFNPSSQPSWHLEFSCPSHGRFMAFVASLESLVSQALKEAGIGDDAS